MYSLVSCSCRVCFFESTCVASVWFMSCCAWWRLAFCLVCHRCRASTNEGLSQAVCVCVESTTTISMLSCSSSPVACTPYQMP